MSKVLPTQYQQFIHLSRYSRWLDDERRRETWEETVERYFNFFDEHLKERCGYSVAKNIREELKSAILNLDVMPSMRCLMTAGKALQRDETAGYNCSFLNIDKPRSFDEILYILSCGTGIGFSVERQYINQLPIVADEFYDSDTVIAVADSRVGWAKSLKELISLLYSGQVPKWDLSKVRPAGAPLKTFGGRASGPEPLNQLFKFCVKTFKQSSGRKLTSLECHDIVCKIAECIVVGGVRRSACISLSNLSDDRMRSAKTGRWWETEPQRALANNSAVYTEIPDIGIFMDEWKSLYESKSGERGIFNRAAAKEQAKRTGRRDSDHSFGPNPCTEILLRPDGLCNLSETIIRAEDSRETIIQKVKLATILGTWQSTLTHFRYLSKNWQKNAEEERLLGVSLTGIKDNAFMGVPSEELNCFLQELKQVAIDTNKLWAKKLKIEESVATTCVKPSGSVSQLVNSSSGIHDRYAEFYIRSVRADNKDPLCKFMIANGFPHEPCVVRPDYTTVFYFPIKSPENSIFRNDCTAIQQLELWMTYKKNWCEHTVSITVSVKEHEWLDVAAWVYKNLSEITGVSFLPYSDHIYRQAPYEECSLEEYESLLQSMPKDVNWSDLAKFESEDNSRASHTLACSGDSCEIVDLV
jgi:ribonucleoside-diphosphate reductase alpha chain